LSPQSPLPLALQRLALVRLEKTIVAKQKRRRIDESRRTILTDSIRGNRRVLDVMGSSIKRVNRIEGKMKFKYLVAVKHSADSPGRYVSKLSLLRGAIVTIAVNDEIFDNLKIGRPTSRINTDDLLKAVRGKGALAACPGCPKQSFRFPELN
jgi:ribosomal protein S8E